MGKDDLGQDYKVRTTDHAEITDTDVQELRDADREAYEGDRGDAAWAAVHKLIGSAERTKTSRENTFGADLLDASEQLVRAATTKGRATRPGMIDLPSSYGSTRLIRARWPKDWD